MKPRPWLGGRALGLGGLFLLLGWARPVAALDLSRGRFCPAAGIAWEEPLDANVRDLYGGGIGIFGAVDYILPPRLRAELHAGWIRRSANPPSLLASQSESRLTLVPVTLEAHLAFPHRDISAIPFLLAGPAVVFASERFTTTLLVDSNQSSGSDTDWGAVGGVGVETTGGPVRWRLVGRAILTGGHRGVVRANGRTDSRGDMARASIFTAGLEVALP